MKLLIEVPTWLGDAVMVSGAVDKLIGNLNPNTVIIFGSFVSTELFKNHPKVSQVIIDDRNHRFKQLFKIRADFGVSFRSSFYSKLFMKFSAKESFNFSKNYEGHQVEKYNKFVDIILNKNLEIYTPKLYFTPFKYQKPTLGINPGATYGSAKRWYPKEFAKVANEMAKKYDIIIFGGPGEEDIAKDIEKSLTIKNYQNLCGKLSIQELCEKIAGLSMFVTNDSGPMHIASAYNVPIVAIFGPTKFTETSPYSKNYKIVTKNLECAPCMKRECPLKTHECMKEIKADEVIQAIKELNESIVSR
jgi:heptosyltransferase-2